MNAALNGSIRGRGNPGAKRGGSGANTPSGQPVQSTASPSNSAARPQSQAPPRWGHAQGNSAHNAGTGPGQAATKGVQSPVVNGVGHGSEPADPRMRDRLLMLTLTLVGSQVIIRTSADGKYVGILSAASLEGGELGVTLSQACKLPHAASAMEGPWETLSFQGKDVLEVEVSEVKLSSSQAAAERSNSRRTDFQTDVEISAAHGGDGISRSLQKWSDDGATATEDLLAPGGRGDGGKWDQFATNEAKFGLKTSYDEELYTTKLDRSRPDFAAKEKEAERLAAEIMGQATTDAHLAEERGQHDDSGQNEEDKYGAVQRNPNAYVPPGRRTAQVASAKALAAVSQSAIARSSADAVGQTTAASTAVPKKDKVLVYDEFNRFVQKEQSQAQAALQHQQAKSEKDSRLADLKNWGSSFKLKSPIPSDIVAAKSSAPQAASSDNSVAARKPSSNHSENRLPKIEEAPPSKVASVEDAKYSLAKMSIPKIPPFNPGKARIAVAPSLDKGEAPPTSTGPAPDAEGMKTSSPSLSTLKLSAKASAFKPFNPAAAAFKPGQAAQAAPAKPAAAPVIPEEPQSVSSPEQNPFFGSKEPKRQSSGAPINVFSDFSPLRSQRKSDPPSMITPWWPFNGRDFKVIFAPSGPPAPASGSPFVPPAASTSDHPSSKSPGPAPARVAPGLPLQSQAYIMGANGAMAQPPYGFAYPPGAMGSPYRFHPQAQGASPRPFPGHPAMPGVAMPAAYFSQAPFSPPMPPHGPGGGYSPHLANAGGQGPPGPFVIAQASQGAPMPPGQRPALPGSGPRSSFSGHAAPGGQQFQGNAQSPRPVPASAVEG